MQITEHTLTLESRSLKIKVNPEDPYVRIFNFQTNNSKKALFILTQVKRQDSNIEQTLMHSENHDLNTLSFIPIIDDPTVSEIQLTLKTSLHPDPSFSFRVQSGATPIDLSSPVEKFRKHLKNPINSKILVSAPFGQGKTTFLDYYFEEETKVYDVFKVFPVNYSVSSNEDVFRYIKTDILFQLLGKDIAMDKEEIPLSTTAQEFIYIHPDKMIANFLKMLMSLDKRTDSLQKAISILIQEISEYHNAQQIDDETKAIKYIKEIYEQEGSIFEDNFYTQLIRQLLERLKENTKNESVLIIEDLDRMDPDHIFRILNVISAHYDTYRHSQDQEHHNKFGFDKIIIVCDKNNIENIFHHKYGEKTDFDGYFNKYFSSQPFFYDNNEMIRSLVDKYFPIPKDFDRRYEAHHLLTGILIECNQLTIRELLKVKRMGFEDFDAQEQKYSVFERSVFTKSLKFYIRCLGLDTLVRKIRFCQQQIVKPIKNYEEWCKLLLIAIGDEHKKEDLVTIVFKGIQYTIFYSEDFKGIIKCDNIERKALVTASAQRDLVENDLFDLLIQNIEFYRKSENIYN